MTEANTQCPEVGPFFPFTSGMATQLGLSRNDDILLAPDWILIGSVIGGAVGIMLLVIAALVRLPMVCIILINS